MAKRKRMPRKQQQRGASGGGVGAGVRRGGKEGGGGGAGGPGGSGSDYYMQPGRRGSVIVLRKPIGNRISPKICGTMPSRIHAKMLITQLEKAESVVKDLFLEATDDGIEALEAVLAACRDEVMRRGPRVPGMERPGRREEGGVAEREPRSDTREAAGRGRRGRRDARGRPKAETAMAGSGEPEFTPPRTTDPTEQAETPEAPGTPGTPSEATPEHTTEPTLEPAVGPGAVGETGAIAAEPPPRPADAAEPAVPSPAPRARKAAAKRPAARKTPAAKKSTGGGRRRKTDEE